jgi:DNA-binding response OmpR family regulator
VAAKLARTNANILVVDDEVEIRELLSEILADEGHMVRLAESATAAREARSRELPDLVLLDVGCPTPMASRSSKNGPPAVS